MTEPTPGTPRRRGTLIALIALPVAAAVLAAGAAVAVAANRVDDHRDSGSTSGTGGAAATSGAGGSAPTSSSGASGASSTSGAPGAPVDGFVAARDAAERAVPGSTTHVTRTARGWQVEIRRADSGADVDLALAPDFTVTSTDAHSGSGRDDAPASGSLSGDVLNSALTAALGAAGSGTLSSIDLGASTHAAYDVVVTQGQTVVEIDLAQDFRVLRTETEIED
ncbi:MAG: hypothetical protein HY996_03995 [Micrococcales bacterium]|nr:hypothetical protein [Micrococcales bacterium]